MVLNATFNKILVISWRLYSAITTILGISATASPYGWDGEVSISLEQSEDTTEVIRSHKSRKNRQYNGQKKKDKSTNTDIQNTTKKNKD